MSTGARSQQDLLEDPDMVVVIGPILKHDDGYRFDTYTCGKGTSIGFAYHRIEDAQYARNATIRDSAQGRTLPTNVCQTLDEFISRSAAYATLVAA
jgi:hypothetical protein